MSRRPENQSIDSSPAETAGTDPGAVQDDDMDDELARELEQERQQILAAAGRAAAAQNGNTPSVQSHDTEGEDGSQSEFEQEEEEDLDPDDIPDQDDSEDEWQPPQPASRSTRQSKRRRRHSSTEGSDEESHQQAPEDDNVPATKKSKKMTSAKPSGLKKSNGTHKKAKNPAIESTTGGPEEQYDSFDEEAERVQAEVEAAAAWADVRRRKEAAASDPLSATNSQTEKAPTHPAAAAPSLSAWLGKGPSASSSVSELASSLPMPTTCTAAQVVDRSSLFIGYVYPLTTASSAYISTLLSHLTRVVHPTVPVSLLPPQFANARANKRGSSHDMYAYRVFELKRGRTGLAGPDDFSLQEDKEDDGERWGGDRVLRVAREEGSSDVLVVVSRWYGGELLGPVRFDHIENAARAALQEHMQKEEVEEFRQRIQHLDRKIAQLKAKLQQQGSNMGGEETETNKYPDLTLEKAQRLWLARQKALDALQKRLVAAGQPTSQSQSDPAVDASSASPSLADEAGSIPATEPEAEPPNATESAQAVQVAPGAATVETSTPARTDIAPPITVKPEPSDEEPISPPSPPAPIIKAEPFESSPSTVTVKQEQQPEPSLHPIITSTPTPDLNIEPEQQATTQINPQLKQEQEEEELGMDLKQEQHADDEAEAEADLTGWDDLS